MHPNLKATKGGFAYDATFVDKATGIQGAQALLRAGDDFNPATLPGDRCFSAALACPGHGSTRPPER